MNSRILSFTAVALLAAACFAAEPAKAVRGTISKIGSDGKTVVVKTADGTAHTFRWVAGTTVHGAKDGAVDSARGLKEGSEVLVHYTGEGTEKTAVEIDHVGKDGYKVLDGTVTRTDHAAKIVAVKSADGAEETFKLADHAVVDSGKGIAKGAKVTVYYTGDGVKKVAHYLGKL